MTQTKTMTDKRWFAKPYKIDMICEYTKTYTIVAVNEQEALEIAKNRMRLRNVTRINHASLGDIEVISCKEAT